MTDLIVRSGTVVDGTGAPGRVADVRVRDGIIVEVAPGLVPDGETEVDASGALVTPGLIDSHTHYDLEMFWDPSLDPLPVYGITTIVMGNCGLGIAPVTPEVSADIADLLCFVEELPPSLAVTDVPWGWRAWSEYAQVARHTPLAVQAFAYTAHGALRAAVLGHDAWERAATPDEVALMCELLDDALRAGSLGMSSNWFDTDRNRQLVPSRLCDEAELDALLDTLARHSRATFQVIARSAADRRRALEHACSRGLKCLSLGDGTGGAKVEPGLDTWYLGGGNQPFTPMLGFEASIATAAIPPWHELVNGPADTKLTTLADPEWRARARAAWDDPLPEQNSFRSDALHLLMLTDSENGTGPVDVSLAQLAADRGQHPSDALADWILANGIGSRYTKLSSTTVPMTDDDRRMQVVHDAANPFALMGGTDAGAHLTMFCGAGSNLYLLTHWARDDGALSVEQAIHCITQRSADFFGLTDRGVIEPGRRGDLAVFALDEIETRDFERRYDLPEGRYRLSRPPAGFRAVAVAGELTVLNGEPTGARPTTLGARP
ncbi:MAG: amidohydrolase family protein [Acidimicrobiales bacterium]|nr:amidohydrolase family protein [Acidimicrobiales bacterium]